MEEKELLSPLKTILFTLITITTVCKASYSSRADNYDFTTPLLKDARQLVIDNSWQELINFQQEHPINIAGTSKKLENPISEAKLLVFVSTSMPESLLKSYYKEASSYNAILVFKGLPNGSFNKLAELILKLQGDQSETKDGESLAGSIIDDESFNKFGIDRVPTIALIKEEECFEHSSCKITYDIINGNIGIKGALKQFAQDGDLKIAASSLLYKQEER